MEITLFTPRAISRYYRSQYNISHCNSSLEYHPLPKCHLLSRVPEKHITTLTRYRALMTADEREGKIYGEWFSENEGRSEPPSAIQSKIMCDFQIGDLTRCRTNIPSLLFLALRTAVSQFSALVVATTRIIPHEESDRR